MRRPAHLLIAVGLLAGATVLFAACSKDKKTNPGPGSGLLDLPLAMNGGSRSFTFNDLGTFNYHCGVHTNMVGNSVIVSASSSVDSALVTVNGTAPPGFSPSAATVRQGGTVRWVNISTTFPHSVVSD